MGQGKTYAKFYFAKNKEIPFKASDSTPEEHVTCQEYFQKLFSSIFGDQSFLRLNFLDHVGYQATETVPQTIEKFINQKIKGEREFQFEFCKFSPSFNIRVFCRTCADCEALKGHFTNFEAKDLRNAVIENKESSKLQKKEKILSIHSSRVTDFFEELNTGRPFIEHVFRYGYLSHKYCIKKGNVRHNEENYYDLKYISNDKIEFDTPGTISIDEFMQKMYYQTKYKSCSIKDQLVDLMEKTRIREEDIRYFFTYVMNNGKKFHFYATPLINDIGDFFVNFYSGGGPGQHEVPLLPFRPEVSLNCHTKIIFELANHRNEGIKDKMKENLPKSIQNLSKFFYISFTSLIIEQFTSFTIKDPDFGNKVGSLQDLQEKIKCLVIEILNSNFTLIRADHNDAVDNFLFFFYVFEEVAIFSFLKGNFFLFETLSEIFQRIEFDQFNQIAPPVIQQNLRVIRNFLSRNANDNLFLLWQYTYTDNMIVLPFLSCFAQNPHVPLTDEILKRIHILASMKQKAPPKPDICDALLIPREDLKPQILLAGDLQCSASFRTILPFFRSHVSVLVECCRRLMNDDSIELETILNSRVSIISKVCDATGDQETLDVLLSYNFARPIIIDRPASLHLAETLKETYWEIKDE